MEHTEIECRFLEIDKERLIGRLWELGATDHGEKHLTEVILYDTDLKWVEEDKRLRLRKVDDSILLSYKEHTEHTIDGTLEIEFPVGDMAKAEIFLEKLGYPAYRHQEKFRHTFELEGITFDIDTWPQIPTYVELEGESEEIIQAAAKAVGLNWEDAIFHNPSWVIENKYNIPVRSLRWFMFNRIE